MAVLGPPLPAGAFIGLTATRGIPLMWWERAGIGLRTSALMAVCLLGAAGAVGGLRRQGFHRAAQLIGGALAALLLFILMRSLSR
jgi:hypothetical protein